MGLKKYDKNFIEKYHDGAEDANYLYEYKSGEFQSGEIVGMVSIQGNCKGTVYNYNKSSDKPWINYTQIGEFVGEEYNRETDLQFPICDNC